MLYLSQSVSKCIFRVHNLSQWPNLGHLGESLGGAEGLLEAVSFKKATKSRMPDGSEFQTAGAATLKPREAKVVRTRGADNRLVFAGVESVWECGN